METKGEEDAFLMVSTLGPSSTVYLGDLAWFLSRNLDDSILPHLKAWTANWLAFLSLTNVEDPDVAKFWNNKSASQKVVIRNALAQSKTWRLSVRKDRLLDNEWKSTVMPWDKKTSDDAPQELLFGLTQYVLPIRQWFDSKCVNPVAHTQLRNVLFIDGSVKSGKTVIALHLVPYAINRYRQEKLSEALSSTATTATKSTAEKLKNPIVFGHLDCSVMLGERTVTSKWAEFIRLLAEQFGVTPPTTTMIDTNHHTVLSFLKQLTQGKDVSYWVVSLDEVHSFFIGLSKDDATKMSHQFKHVLLDDQHNIHWVLSGSTQSVFWWSMKQVTCNGLSLVRRSDTITTSSTMSPSECEFVCKTMVARKPKICPNAVEFKKVLAAGPANCSAAMICQVMLLLESQTTPLTETAIQAAWKSHITRKYEVYQRDYTSDVATANVGGVTKFYSYCTPAGGKDPSIDEQRFLKENKQDNSYVFADDHFNDWLRASMNPADGTIIANRGDINWEIYELCRIVVPIAEAIWHLPSDTSKTVCLAGWVSEIANRNSTKLGVFIGWLKANTRCESEAKSFDVGSDKSELCYGIVRSIRHISSHYEKPEELAALATALSQWCGTHWYLLMQRMMVALKNALNELPTLAPPP